MDGRAVSVSHGAGDALSVPAATIRLDCPRGEARTYSGTHYSGATSTTPVDITGWTIKVTARNSTTQELVLNKTASIVSGPNGTYSWSATHTDSLLNPGAYALDIQRTDSGAETLLGLGTWTITAEVLY